MSICACVCLVIDRVCLCMINFVLLCCIAIQYYYSHDYLFFGDCIFCNGTLITVIILPYHACSNTVAMKCLNSSRECSMA